MLVLFRLCTLFSRRPFGIEKKFFVQLFLEIDEAQKLFSVGDLVNKMFSEQQISFTEVCCIIAMCISRLTSFTLRFLQNYLFKSHEKPFEKSSLKRI